MKSLSRILILVIIFIPLFGIGQDTLTTLKSVGIYNGVIQYEKPKPIYDTIKVIMLVSDTCCRWVDSISSIEVGRSSKSVHWQYGYGVRKITCCGWSYDSKGFEYQSNIYTHIEYLDADKKPLPKNIVIWQVK